MNEAQKANQYAEACRETFWQKVFEVEVEYLRAKLEGCQTILSVGCGPAMIEGALAEKGYRVTGLDISAEALKCAPDGVRTIIGRAEDMSFPDASFDAVIFVASLQFIEDYERALARATAALKPGGKVIIMLLNPASAFFQAMRQSPESYVRWIRHTDLDAIEKEAGCRLALQTEYFLGICGEDIFDSRDPAWAALYVLLGEKAAQNRETRNAN